MHVSPTFGKGCICSGLPDPIYSVNQHLLACPTTTWILFRIGGDAYPAAPSGLPAATAWNINTCIAINWQTRHRSRHPYIGSLMKVAVKHLPSPCVRAAPAQRFGAQCLQLNQTARCRAAPARAIAEDTAEVQLDAEAAAAAKAALQQQPHRGTPSRHLCRQDGAAPPTEYCIFQFSPCLSYLCMRMQRYRIC